MYQITKLELEKKKKFDFTAMKKVDVELVLRLKVRRPEIIYFYRPRNKHGEREISNKEQTSIVGI
jgi:hypothetical protein